MTNQRDLERRLDQWLADGPTEAPDRVLAVVSDRIARHRQRPAWRVPSWRNPEMNAMPKLAVAAAVVLALAVGVVVLRPSSGTVGGPGVTPPSPELSDDAVTPTYAWPALLEAGTYTTRFIWDIPFDLSFEVPAGWESRDIEVIKDPNRATEGVGGAGGVGVSFTLAGNAYARYCEPEMSDPPVGGSVAAFAAALATMPGLDASQPASVSFDRQTTGQYLTFTADQAGCALWQLREDAALQSAGPVGGLTWRAEQVNNRVWVLDIDEVRLVISAFWAPDATTADLAELQAVIDSIRIVRPGSTAPPEPVAP